MRARGHGRRSRRPAWRNVWRMSWDRETKGIFGPATWARIAGRRSTSHRPRRQLRLASVRGHRLQRPISASTSPCAFPRTSCFQSSTTHTPVNAARSSAAMSIGAHRARCRLGTYVYGDLCTGEIFTWNGTSQTVALDTTLKISSFGEDEQGELYVVDINSSSGTVSKIVSAGAPTATPTPTRTPTRPCRHRRRRPGRRRERRLPRSRREQDADADQDADSRTASAGHRRQWLDRRARGRADRPTVPVRLRGLPAGRRGVGRGGLHEMRRQLGQGLPLRARRDDLTSTATGSGQWADRRDPRPALPVRPHRARRSPQTRSARTAPAVTADSIHRVPADAQRPLNKSSPRANSYNGEAHAHARYPASRARGSRSRHRRHRGGPARVGRSFDGGVVAVDGSTSAFPRLNSSRCWGLRAAGSPPCSA